MQNVDIYTEIASTRSKVSSKDVPEIHGQRYLKERLSATELRTEFSKRACCQANCVERLLQMPRDTTVSSCCATHFATLTYCPSVGSQQKGNSETFDRLVNNIREATRKFSGESAEAKRAMQQFLMNKFSEGKHSRSKTYEWRYDVISPDHRHPITVCKNAFVAIYGIKLSTLEYVQRLIRKEATYNNVNRTNEKLTIQKAFETWGMDVNFYHQNIANFCDFNSIPETEGSLVAAAFLSDFFDLASEHQPTGT